MKKSKKRKNQDLDWASDQYFQENRVMLYIEHTDECPVFRQEAEKLADFFQGHFPDKIIQLVRNKGGKEPGRPGAFEVSYSQNARTSLHQIWSGIDKGPPRREKIPINPEIFLPEMTRILKRIYVAPVAKIDDDLQKPKDDEEVE